MKVFEVITEHEKEDKGTAAMRQYVTQQDNSLEKVAAHFQNHCEQYEEELIAVTYVCTLVQHIE